MLAPIVLFVYNKPWHTRQCLESLSKNLLADKSVLYIYLDGPPEDSTAENLDKVKEVEELINEKKWCAETHIFKASENNGIGNSVINGVTETLNRHEKVIVLEDDLVLSKGFLKYMNAALDFYEKEPKVMHISGFMFPVSGTPPQTFFYNSTTCWGWATWSRAWKQFSSDSDLLWKEIVSRNLVNNFTIDHTMDFEKLLLQNAMVEKQEKELQKIRSSNRWNWDMCWHASVCLAGGFCLHPFPSLTRNIGHDETGMHCKKNWRSGIYSNQKIANEIQVAKIPIENNKTAWNAMKKFNNQQPGLWLKVKEKIQLTLGDK